jgi:hypothetical protein
MWHTQLFWVQRSKPSFQTHKHPKAMVAEGKTGVKKSTRFTVLL